VARKAIAVAVLLLALVPAARLAWMAREMPHFGHLHDDSIYFVAAKSMADSRGYRILSLPGEPFQTKYPPLWPLALAAVWKIDPRFPENLRWAMALAWVMLPAFMVLAWCWFRSVGFGPAMRTTLCAVLVLSPWVVFLSTTLMSELIFSVALLAALLALERAKKSPWLALAAGLLGAVAYLIKTAALPLLVVGPLWLIWRRQYRSAAVFFCAMFPAVAAWMLWAGHHMTGARDIVSLYYTNYLGYQIYNIGWRDLPLVMWKNLDGVFSGVAGLLIFDLGKSVLGMHLSRFLAIGAIAGVVRMARTRGLSPYHGFAAAYTAILLVWHFPPNERFVLPLFPLLLAGLESELAHLGGVIRSVWRQSAANRVVAAGMIAGAATFAGFGIVLNAGAIFGEFPGIIGQHREVLASNRAAFAWIAQHESGGAFYAYDDPVFFLYTGHHAVSLPVAPMPFYREDREAILAPFRNMPAFAREQRLDYLFFTTADFHRDLPESERAEVRRILSQEPEMVREYARGLSAIYRLKPTGAESRLLPTPLLRLRSPR
jgi:hypothetical protein